MKIKTVHAHFLISLGGYSNERIGFAVEVDDGESIEEIVSQLRDRAKKIVGKKASELYDEKFHLENVCDELEAKLDKLRKEWDATSQFLRAQGLNPEAPSMPQFRKLLEAVTVKAETVIQDENDEDDDDQLAM